MSNATITINGVTIQVPSGTKVTFNDDNSVSFNTSTSETLSVDDNTVNDGGDVFDAWTKRDGVAFHTVFQYKPVNSDSSIVMSGVVDPNTARVDGNGHHIVMFKTDDGGIRTIRRDRIKSSDVNFDDTEISVDDLRTMLHNSHNYPYLSAPFRAEITFFKRNGDERTYRMNLDSNSYHDDGYEPTIVATHDDGRYATIRFENITSVRLLLSE